MNYYNEIDPSAATWLRELVAAGHLPAGDIDTRSIEDVTPNDIRHYTQCHFFAGIGGWPLALHLAGVPDSAEVWTGSCPCQPFSAAGRQRGFADERHLWPAFFHLISQCRPSIVFGEQVAGRAGEQWLDLVQDDLEAEDYACGAVTFPACSVGAPHIRQRLYWVAHADNERRDREHALLRQKQVDNAETSRRGATDGRVGNALGAGLEGYAGDVNGAPWRASDRPVAEAGASVGFWSSVEWLPYIDGKLRPSEPGTLPVADGVPARVGRLRGYGNAIVPQQAAAFIKTFKCCMA